MSHNRHSVSAQKLRESSGANAPLGPCQTCDAMRSRLDELTTTLRDVRALVQATHDRVAGTVKEFFSVSELARLVDRSEFTVRRWIKQGWLEAERVSGTGPRGRLLISRSELPKLIGRGLSKDLPLTGLLEMEGGEGQ